MRAPLFILAGPLILACAVGPAPVTRSPSNGAPVVLPVALDTGSTIAARFAPPAGATRAPLPPGSFGHTLRTLRLKASDAPVHLYDGSLKPRQDVHAAVVDLSVGRRDLQQCADAVMRLRAEHLFAQGRLDDIHFHFTNGFRTDFRRWANGQRIEVEGAHGTRWVGGGRPDSSHTALLAYLEKVFTYAGTLSLSKELQDASARALEPGDVFIHGSSPGHAMIVVDVARTENGRTYFLLAQSYMPAQDIHVVKNLEHPELGAWFELNDGAELVTPEWTFGWSERKRW